MSWNYRVMRQTLTAADGSKADEYFIGEAYYDDEGRIHSWSGPIFPHGPTRENLINDFSMMMLALTKPVWDTEERTEIPIQ